MSEVVNQAHEGCGVTGMWTSQEEIRTIERGMSEAEHPEQSGRITSKDKGSVDGPG